AAPADEMGGARERELIYRALLELRMEIREIKDALRSASKGATRSDSTERDFVIVNRPESEESFEEVVYEIEPDEEPTAVQIVDEPVEPEAAISLSGELPTLHDAERHLISEALRRFDGNRRQTAKALGISERTLYRKINEMEENETVE
ncbi:MAG: sigma-54-dependent Fis family transcriptional regulator, partial [Rhodothermales bacterium]|nr:sigma-54-dependent Fis family transcriptional regulator [Rhodothermales bacterium]